MEQADCKYVCMTPHGIDVTRLGLRMIDRLGYGFLSMAQDEIELLGGPELLSKMDLEDRREELKIERRHA
jgi:hypothetical protein